MSGEWRVLCYNVFQKLPGLESRPKREVKKGVAWSRPSLWVIINGAVLMSVTLQLLGAELVEPPFPQTGGGVSTEAI